jgi:hypothetical protein
MQGSITKWINVSLLVLGLFYQCNVILSYGFLDKIILYGLCVWASLSYAILFFANLYVNHKASARYVVSGGIYLVVLSGIVVFWRSVNPHGQITGLIFLGFPLVAIGIALITYFVGMTLNKGLPKKS